MGDNLVPQSCQWYAQITKMVGPVGLEFFDLQAFYGGAVVIIPPFLPLAVSFDVAPTSRSVGTGAIRMRCFTGGAWRVGCPPAARAVATISKYSSGLNCRSPGRACR